MEWEELGLIEGSGERPADVVSIYLPTHLVAVDVTVTHVLTATYYTHDDARLPGHALDTEEKDKNTNTNGERGLGVAAAAGFCSTDM